MDTQRKGMTWAGWIISALIGLLLVSTGLMTVANPSAMAEQFVDKFGYPSDLIVPVAVAEICCAIVYLIPRTATLGAVLLTGYLGGAIATHARVHDNFAPAAIVGILVWLALYLRDPRIRALMPLVSGESK
jgi:uncharacterized membrane protein YphA (DoxX/SURF4 family)